MTIVAKTIKERAGSNKAPSSRKINEKAEYCSKPSGSVLRLQQTIGNKALQGLFETGFIQGKLTIGQPNDVYEQEADRVAEEIMRMPEPEIQRQPVSDEKKELLQSKLAENSQVMPKIDLRTKQETEQTSPVSESLTSRIGGIKGGGVPLSEAERDYFEPRFGRRFSDVRIHHNSKANKLAKSVNSQAFTYGSDIVFGVGRYAPNSHSGKNYWRMN